MDHRATKHSKPINLFFTLWTLEGRGGSETVVYELARSLDPARYRMGIVSMYDGPVRDEYEALGVQVHVIPRRGVLDRSFYRRFRALLREQRVDVLNAHHYGAFFTAYIASRGTRTRLVYTEHSRWELEGLKGINRPIVRFMSRHADGCVAVSRELHRYFIEELGVPPSKAHLLRNGVDTAAFSSPSSHSVRTELGIGASDKIVGIVAHLRPEKNHAHLIRAFDILASRRDDVHLVMAGRDLMGGQVQGLLSDVASADRIHFLGERSDIPDLLEAFDVFCLPSRYEGLPLTVLEAMASGTPVVGANVLGINEVVDDGRNGLLYPAGDRDALADRLDSVLSDRDLSHRLAEVGREDVHGIYSLEAMSGAYDTLFETIARSGASSLQPA